MIWSSRRSRRGYISKRCSGKSCGRCAPELLKTEYGKEIWALYEHSALHPEVQLTGRFAHSKKPVDLNSVIREIDDARVEEAARRLRMQESVLTKGGSVSLVF